MSDAGIVTALAHPLRARLLAEFESGEASPKELADRLGEKLGNVSYHVRILRELALIELSRTTPRRGALEHHYRAVDRDTATINFESSLTKTGWSEASDAALALQRKLQRLATKHPGSDRRRVVVAVLRD